MDNTKIISNAKKNEEDTGYYWRYDNGKYMVCIVQGQKVKSEQWVSEADLANTIGNSDYYKKRKIKSVLQGGLDQEEAIEYSKKDLSHYNDAFLDIAKLVDAYASSGCSTAFLRLMTYVLSGYTYRSFMEQYENPHLLSYRAPVVQIKPHSKDFCEGFEHLSNLVECFVCSTAKNTDMVHHNPIVLPSNYLATRIDECAYMYIRRKKELGVFPSCYRDTTVLLHHRFFKSDDIAQFTKRNVWATVLVFGSSVPDKINPVHVIDLNDMSLDGWNWDTEEGRNAKNRIAELTGSFISWLHCLMYSLDKKIRVERWMNAGYTTVRKYNLASARINKPVCQGSEALYLCAQIAALDAFLEFCYSKQIIDEETWNRTWDTWVNEILPGSREAEIYHKSIRKQEEAKQKKKEAWLQACQKLFTEFLTKAEDEMITNRKCVNWEEFFKSFMPEDKPNNEGKDLPEETPREENAISYKDRFCIFTDIMKPTTIGDGKKFPCVLILRKDLEQFSKEHNGEFDKIISDLWQNDFKENEDFPKVDFIHTSNNICLGKKQPHGVVLKTEEMLFLPQGVREKLIKSANRK